MSFNIPYAEQKLQELARGGQKGTEVLTPEQVKTIEKFKTDLLATREELRSVQFELRKDVDWIKNAVMVVNVAGIPLIVGLMALLFAFRSRRRALPRKEA